VIEGVIEGVGVLVGVTEGVGDWSGGHGITSITLSGELL
jgi:hypothetical protein